MLKIHTSNLKTTNDTLFEKQRMIEIQAALLEENNKKLEYLNSTKDRFFSIIAHDLRNPFYAIKGFGELLLRNYSKLSEDKITKYLGLIASSAAHGSELLENLLQWSRSQSGSIVFMPEKRSLRALVEDIVGLLEGDALRKNISIHQNISPELEVVADANMLQTIFRNLISNAIKFTPENGTIHIDTETKLKEVLISIKDSGVGINPATIPLLFKIDTIVSTPGTAKETGTGLGLVLCKEFVEKHGGRIWVESSVNEGSTFFLYNSNCLKPINAID